MADEKMDTGEAPEQRKEESKRTAEKPEEETDPYAKAIESLRGWCGQLEKGETSIVPRVLQSLNSVRKHLSTSLLSVLMNHYLGQGSAIVQRDALLAYLEPLKAGENAISVDDLKLVLSPTQQKGQIKTAAALPELELYIRLLSLLLLFDKQQGGVECDPLGYAKELIDRVDQMDKRTHDPFLAKAFAYYVLIVEKKGDITQLPAYLNSRLRLASLRYQYETEAVLIVSILRAHLLLKDHNAATRFVEKVKFPESANNNQMARFNYYQGRIKALQLDYESSAKLFQQALRKAPQDCAIGFKQNVQKWIIVIGLLQGEIPERAVFRDPIHRITLAPYMKLAQAVRLGDISDFNKVLADNSDSFRADETLSLIARLRQNVIRIAIKKMALAYSRISIKSMALKLQMSSEAEAEYVVEKAIKDGTIDAVLDYDKASRCRYLRSKETQTVYRTTEPQSTYDSRIMSCLTLHNQAVKALRYPAKLKEGEVESIEQQRERELMEMEFASEMADDDEDF